MVSAGGRGELARGEPVEPLALLPRQAVEQSFCDRPLRQVEIAPAEDVSDELRTYPKDLLTRPLDVREATFSWDPGSGAGEVADLVDDPASPVEDRSGGGLGDLVGLVLVTATTLVIAWGWRPSAPALADAN